MMPAEYRSLRPSTLLEATCSGDMYWGVPTVVPVLVAVPPTPLSSVNLAIPKSATLTIPSQLAFDPVLADVAFARDPRRRGDGGDRRRRRGRWRDRDEAHRGGRVRRGVRCRWGRIGRIRRRSPRRNRGGGLGWLTGIGHLWASLPESFGPESGMAFWRRCA